MDVHELVMKGMYALVALHVLAALKHQFVDKDNVLHRMIPWIPRRDQDGLLFGPQVCAACCS